MTGSFAAVVVLSIAGGVIAFFAFLTERSFDREEKREAEQARLHAAE